MPDLITDIGYPKRITASGVTVVASTGNQDVALVGVMANSGTVGTINVYHGYTTGTGTAIIASGVSLVTGVYTPWKTIGSGGLTVLVTGWTTPDITFYWKPVG